MDYGYGRPFEKHRQEAEEKHQEEIWEEINEVVIYHRGHNYQDGLVDNLVKLVETREREAACMALKGIDLSILRIVR